MMHRWAEYDAGQLRSGDIVQRDECGDETLYWVVAERGIVGPISRYGKHSEAEVVAVATAPAAKPAAVVDYEGRYKTLVAVVVDPKSTKATIATALASLITAAPIDAEPLLEG